MQSSLYVGISAQVALQQRVDVIAQNVANGETAAYRGTEAKFDTVLSDLGEEPVSFVTSNGQTIKQTPGGLTKTDNPLDVAVRGDGWLSVASAQGPIYTRDGRMKIDPGGSLVTLSGAAVLDAGGAQIQLDPAGGPPAIGADGGVKQGGRLIGSLGLYSLPQEAKLSRVEGGFTSSIPGIAVTDFSTNGVVQGFVEQSNVNPILEVTRLIYAQRAFEGVTAAMQSVEAAFKNAIQTIGSSS
jgi:flagellar basal-body rod protein FlgF